MCLTIKNNTRKRTAKKDMTVYKVVNRLTNPYNGKTFFTTPYRAAPVEIGKTYRSELIRYVKNGYKRIDVGIHSFVDLLWAERYVFSATSRVIVRCTIPAGSKYYVGYEHEIASDTLRYDEIIEP